MCIYIYICVCVNIYIYDPILQEFSQGPWRVYPLHFRSKHPWAAKFLGGGVRGGDSASGMGSRCSAKDLELSAADDEWMVKTSIEQ